MPDVVRVATGGKNIGLNSQTVDVLRGRDVSTKLEDMATDEQRRQGLDIADFLLATPTRRQILNWMIERNPNLRQLIDELDSKNRERTVRCPGEFGL